MPPVNCNANDRIWVIMSVNIASSKVRNVSDYEGGYVCVGQGIYRKSASSMWM
jgi:hypothetical protein